MLVRWSEVEAKCQEATTADSLPSLKAATPATKCEPDLKQALGPKLQNEQRDLPPQKGWGCVSVHWLGGVQEVVAHQEPSL